MALENQKDNMESLENDGNRPKNRVRIEKSPKLFRTHANLVQRPTKTKSSSDGSDKNKTTRAT